MKAQNMFKLPKMECGFQYARSIESPWFGGDVLLRFDHNHGEVRYA
jgi:hypothetical protein